MLDLDLIEYEDLIVDSHERDRLLDMLFASVGSDHYINPHGIIFYLKTCYPMRWEKRMKELDEA